MGIARLGAQWGRQLATATAAPAPQRASARQGVSGSTATDPDDSSPPPNENENFEALTKYIPTETITLFVAAIGAWKAIEELGTALPAWAGPMNLIIYAVFAALTPLMVWLVAYSTYARARKGQPEGTAVAPFAMPVFRMIAALVAFLIWALAVPGVLASPVWQIVAPLAALVVSTFLSLFEPIFGN